ncbi:MAG: PEGA domain-containing protein [Candidatus Kerfeldbacteria bacterium]
MNIWARRTYFIITILVFILVAIVLIFYASGWRYNSSTNKLGLVGAITVDTEPNNAIVYLNDDKLKGNTPTNYNTIIEDNYDLKIYKEGYFDWVKNISIEQSKTTRIPKVQLLKKQDDLKPLLSYEKINNFSFSPDKNKIAISTPGLFEIIDLDANKTIFTKKTEQVITNIQWNINSERLIYYSSLDGYTATNLRTSKELLINLILDNIIDNIYWSTNEEDIIFITSHNVLHRINIFQNIVTEILSEKNIVFSIEDKYFNLQNNNLQVIDQEEKQLATINISDDSKLFFLDQFEDYLPIINQTNNKAYFYNLSDNSFEEINETVENIKWINNKLLFSNNHEIWCWDKNESTKEIILRTSENISQADWLLNEYYTLYTTNNEDLNIIQSVGTQKNTYSLGINNITNITSKYSENVVYIVTDKDIYKLEF